MTSVLIADAERSIRSILKERLEYEGCVIDVAGTTEDVVSKVTNPAYDIMLMDVGLPYKGGVHALINFVHTTTTPSTAIIVLSNLKSVEMAVDCMKAGACDYVLKPIDFGKLLKSMKDARARQVATSTSISKEDDVSKYVRDLAESMKAEGRATAPGAKADPAQRSSVEDKMIGDSEAMMRLKSIIDKVAASDARVLITGENGTGKELVARRLHDLSRRAKGPFVEVNCAAIPSELIESELFGHEKGSFTSAIRMRKGKFEQANGGTLFLDEIGDMSLSAQAKMLRALQESRISRIGSDTDIHVDVRIVAATNKNLEHEIKLRNFREDLYHRLSVILIRVPPLSERRTDIPLLVDFFMKEVCSEYKLQHKKVNPECMDALKEMNWTGNIWQLRNVVERLIILSEEEITLEHINMYCQPD